MLLEKGKVLSKLTYRAGTYYDVLPIALDNLQYNQFGTTFGIGIPLTVNQSSSSINLGFNYGVRSGTRTT